MKKLILIFIFCLFTFSIFADPITNVTLSRSKTTHAIFGTVCIGKYKFAWVKAPGHNGVSLTQIFEKTKFTNTPQPMRCK